MKALKHLTIAVFFIMFNSCQRVQPEKLIGSWKMKDLVDTTRKNIEDKTTFAKNNLLILELVSNGKTIEKNVANYTLNKNIINIKYGGKKLFSYDIILLNDSEMELRHSVDKKIYRYLRIH
jgi:hypothetical protein